LTVIHGQATVTDMNREPSKWNSATGRQAVRKVIRLNAQAASAIRMGHLALLVSDFKQSFGLL